MNKRQALYNDLLAESQAQREHNVAEHRLRTRRIRAGQARRRKLKQRAAQVPLDFLAVGDSWFEYPIYDNGPVIEQTGIVAPVQLGSLGNPPPQILNQALHGQSTREMLKWENQETLISLLQDPSLWLNEQTQLPAAILVSAGGDDIVGDQFVIFLDYGGGGLDAARFEGALASMKASYLDLFAFRDNFAPGVPIIGHCYDYALPNGVVPMCVSTAWLKPSLDFAGYGFNDGLAIVADMIDRFCDMLAGLTTLPKANFTLVDTRKTLIRNATSPTGWANESIPASPASPRWRASSSPRCAPCRRSRGGFSLAPAQWPNDDQNEGPFSALRDVLLAH